MLFRRELAAGPWRDILRRWVPRLAPGFVAAATHGAIRTGHAARALEARETPPRIHELAEGLAYWAANYTHLPESALREVSDGCKGLPGLGFVTFHRYDETEITTHMRALVDEARTRNPGGKIKCVLVSGMGGGTSTGMSVPFLFRVREHLKHKKVRLEVFLATTEGHIGLQNVPEEKLERF